MRAKKTSAFSVNIYSSIIIIIIIIIIIVILLMYIQKRDFKSFIKGVMSPTI